MERDEEWATEFSKSKTPKLKMKVYIPKKIIDKYHLNQKDINEFENLVVEDPDFGVVFSPSSEQWFGGSRKQREKIIEDRDRFMHNHFMKMKSKVQDQIDQIKYEVYRSLKDSTLYNYDPDNFKKLGREKFIEFLVREKNLSDVTDDLVTNPDVYLYEIAILDKLYASALIQMQNLMGYRNPSQLYRNVYEEDIDIDDDDFEEEEEEEEENSLRHKSKKKLEQKMKEEEEKEELKKKSQQRVEKMVKEFEEEKSVREVKNWVKEYEKSIIDFFISPSQRQMIKAQIEKLVPEQKKFIVDMVLRSKAVLNLSPEEQRNYVSDFIRNLARQSSRPSKV
jgi:hypothetical protein